MLNNLGKRLVISTVLPFMLLIVSPLTFYFANISEISFSLYSIVWSMFGVFVSMAFLIFVFLSVSVKIPLLYKITSGLLSGVAIAIWIQSQLFVWDFGPLDGRGIDWDYWTSHMLWEGVVWFFVILIVIFLFVRKNNKISIAMVNFVLVLGIISTFSCYILSLNNEKKINDFTVNRFENIFKFHPENNIIIILLDTFQSDYFDLITKKYPNEIEFLNGFTFYRNTISHFPTTKPSIPAILTTRVYRNEKPFKKYAEKVYTEFDFRDYFKNKGYLCESVGPAAPKGVSMSVVSDYYLKSTPWREFIDFGLFRAIPSFFKKDVYNNGNWLIASFKGDKNLKGHHGDDIRFLELFEKLALIKDDLSNGTFKFYHFYIPHNPFQFDENLQYNQNLNDDSEGFLCQARGALHLANRLLSKIKNLGIYDSSEIIIMSDHGTLTTPPIDRTKPWDALMIPNNVHSSALALLLHKKPFSMGGLKFDDTPLMNSDVSCLLGAKSEAIDCRCFYSSMNGEMRKRSYLFYNWTNENWNDEYLPPMTEYFLEGHSYESKSWRKGEWLYENGQQFAIVQPHYNFGETINFTLAGNSDDFILKGWSAPELNFRWTIDSLVSLHIKLEESPNSDLILRLMGYGYLPNAQIEYQKVRVFVNSQPLAQWNMGGAQEWYEASIPSELVSDNRVINVVFEISNPAAPADFGHSKDVRKLGMAVNELVIEEYDPNRK